MTTYPVSNANWLVGVPSGTGVNAVSSAQFVNVQTWFSTTTYAPGAVVTGPVDGLQYIALVVNLDVPPPAAGTWQRSAYKSADAELIADSCVPLPVLPAFDPMAVYPPGGTVFYNGLQFTTPGGSVGVFPPQIPANNLGWEYVGLPSNALIASLYTWGTTGKNTVDAGIEWYDAYGTQISVASLVTSAGTALPVPVFSPMRENVGEINGSYTGVSTSTWTANPTGYWEVSAGQVFRNPSWSGVQKIKFVYSNALATANCCTGLTYTSDVVSATVEDTGILFRLSDTSNFWLASRSQIAKSVAGVLTVVATYTRLPVGTRAFIQASGSTITLYAYPGANAAPTVVATVTDSFNSTATNHGFYDQVF